MNDVPDLCMPVMLNRRGGGIGPRGGLHASGIQARPEYNRWHASANEHDSMTAPSEPEVSAGVGSEVRAGARSRRPWLVSLLIGLGCFTVYNANLRAITAGDT